MPKNREIIEQLFVIKNLLTRAGRKEMFKGRSLTVSLHEILRIIWQGEADTISEIRTFLSDSLPSLTQKVNKLEDLKYIQRNNSRRDARKNILIVTPKGKRAIREVERKIEIVSSLMFSKYSEKEKRSFMQMLEDLEKFLTIKVTQENKFEIK